MCTQISRDKKKPSKQHVKDHYGIYPHSYQSYIPLIESMGKKTGKLPEYGNEHHQTQPTGNQVQLLSQDCNNKKEN